MNNLIQEIENNIQITVGNLCKNITEKYDLDSNELMKIWNTTKELYKYDSIVIGKDTFIINIVDKKILGYQDKKDGQKYRLCNFTSRKKLKDYSLDKNSPFPYHISVCCKTCLKYECKAFSRCNLLCCICAHKNVDNFLSTCKICKNSYCKTCCKIENDMCENCLTECSFCNTKVFEIGNTCEICDTHVCETCENDEDSHFYGDRCEDCLEKCCNCDTTLYHEDESDECEGCESTICHDCILYVKSSKFCKEKCIPTSLLDKCNDCKICKKKCFGVGNIYDICEDCYPDVSSQLENKRLILLKKKLKEYDLVLRSDSRLCQKYIENDYINMNIDEVVQRMCQMRFLFDYCNMRKVLEKVGQEQYEELDAGYIPDVPVFEWAEYLILEEINSYPTEWPWIVAIINKNKSKFNLCLDELKLLPPKHQFIGGQDYIDALHRFTQFQMD